jgi:hypothetical protein
MHYRNGQEAKNGDKIVQLDNGAIKSIGVLHDATPGNDYCNGYLAPSSTVPVMARLCDCLPLSAITEMLKEKGLDVRPKGI